MDGELEEEQGATQGEQMDVNWRKSRMQPKESRWTVNWRKSRVKHKESRWT